MSEHSTAENVQDATPALQSAKKRLTKTNNDAKSGKAKNPTARRACIMVLGMHRSGTSALTRAISLLGAELPKNLLGALPSNPTGHWEPIRLIGLHDQMLAETGSSWDDWRSFDPGSLGADRLQFYKAEIARLIDEEYGNVPLFVLKDPRISRFVPLYASIFKQMRIDVHYVLISRNPLSVSNSLSARNGLTPTFCGLLWLRHELDAEKNTRNSARVLISYEDLVSNAWSTLSKVVDELQLVWPRAVKDASNEIGLHLSAEHEHHSASYRHLKEEKSLPGWVLEAYSAILALALNNMDATALATLDRVRAEFERSSAIFGNAFYPELRSRLQYLEDQRSAQILAIDQRRSELEEIAAMQERDAIRYISEIELCKSRADKAERELHSVRVSRAVQIALRCSSWKRKFTRSLRSWIIKSP